MLKVAIMQPYIFPYIGYFQLINAANEFVIYDDVNFIKRGWITRNNILTNNKAHLFSIPLEEASQNKFINEIRLYKGLDWKSKLLKTIELAYKKAPSFALTFPVLEEIILNNENNLAQYLMFSLQKISEYLMIDTTFKISSKIEKNKDLKGQDKIIEICKKLDAGNYINAIGGLNLYEKLRFIENNISLNFLKPNQISYTQFGNDFIPSLSIIDVMMFNSLEVIQGKLSQYELL
jgi:hypothetical protein